MLYFVLIRLLTNHYRINHYIMMWGQTLQHQLTQIKLVILINSLKKGIQLHPLLIIVSKAVVYPV